MSMGDSDITRVEALVDLGSLTKWEQNFLYGLHDKLDRGFLLTDREAEKLEEIERERL